MADAIHAQMTKKRQALALGMEYYFTGRPCKRGHYWWRDRNGNCIKCQKVRDRNAKYRNYEAWMFRQKRSQCRNRGIPFTISPEDVTVPEFCPVLGVRLSIEPTSNGSRDATPSLDRINPSGGYVPGNVAVISLRANRLKSDASADELEALAAYVRQQLGK